MEVKVKRTRRKLNRKMLEALLIFASTARDSLERFDITICTIWCVVKWFAPSVHILQHDTLKSVHFGALFVA